MNLAAGPVEVTDRTLRDLARPVLFHYDPAFIELVEHTCTLLQQVFRTRYDVVVMQGETVLGLEAAAAGLISPGDKVLNLVSGSFGKKYENYVEKYGGEVVELAVPYNDAIDPDDVRATLEQNPDIKYLSVVHSETPSTTLNSVQDICPTAKQFGVITIVDTASGLGGERLVPEEWGIDIAVAGPQKCLGGVPGLTIMSVSPDAWRALEKRDPPLRGSYLSILDWKERWIENRVFPFTPLVSNFYALESVLNQVLEEGVDRYSDRHQLIAKACREGVKAMGLELWPAREEIAASAVTGVKMPQGITDEQLRGRMREQYGVFISGGFAETAGKLFRLGHMAKAAHPTYLAAQLAVLDRVLADLGRPVEFGAGVGAAMAALGGWNGG